jgi:hypothetical protein
MFQAGYHVIFLHRARSIQPFAADSGEARAAALARLGAQESVLTDVQPARCSPADIAAGGLSAKQ